MKNSFLNIALNLIVIFTFIDSDLKHIWQFESALHYIILSYLHSPNFVSADFFFFPREDNELDLQNISDSQDSVITKFKAILKNAFSQRFCETVRT